MGKGNIGLKILLFLLRLFFGYILQWRKYRLQRYKSVRSQMNLQMDQLLHRIDRNSYGDVRCTFYVPIWFGKRKLMQTFDYIRFGDSYGGWLCRPIIKGIIGKNYKDGKPKVENFKNEVEYLEKMVKKYGYTVEEANRISDDRRSYLCYPIVDEKGTVLGLMYFDSDKYGCYSDDDNNEVIKMVRSGMEAIKSNLI